jgi:hypothetical protein
VLDDFEPAKHVPFRVGQSLALFRAQGLRDAAHMLAHERLQLEHDSRARSQRRVLPGLEGLFSRRDRGVKLFIGRKRNLSQHLLCRGIDDVAPFAGSRFDQLAVEQHFDSGHRMRQRRRFACHDCLLGSRARHLGRAPSLADT